ncbi:hypothetical protein [Pseudomonas sp. CJQ_11]|uniref:hypothetical protein n=1 Tax=Pseudomonas sp. CJQ_11 TaxID=3367169 RepID=UPI00370A758A
MDGKFAELLTDPFWWISVVVVGVLISVAAAYFKSGADIIAGWVSVRWRASSKARKLKYQEKVISIELDHKLQLALRFEAVYELVRAVLFSVLAMANIVFITMLGIAHQQLLVKGVSGLALISLICAMACYFRSIHIRGMLAKANS